MKKNSKHTEETKKKMSETQKKRWVKRKLNNQVYHSEETKKKISESLIGKKKPKRSEEHNKKISEAMKGIKRSEETKNKMSESQKKRWTKRKSIELENDKTRD